MSESTISQPSIHPSGLGKTSTLIRFEVNCQSKSETSSNCMVSSDALAAGQRLMECPQTTAIHCKFANMLYQPKLEMHATKCATLVLDWFTDSMLRGLEQSSHILELQEAVRDYECNSRLLLTSLM